MERKPAIEVQEMLVENIPAVVELGNALFTAEKAPTLYRCWEEAEVLRIYSSHKDTCLVAIMGHEVVGFALGSLLAKPGSSWKYGWLDWLGVAPSCNRRRVAKRLVKQLQERFVRQEVRIMLVDTYEGNNTALSFFRKFGFGQEIKHVYMSMNLDSHPKAIERIYGDD